MTAIYLLITLFPLASISFRATPFLQTLYRECSGDCRLCGCSAERSVSHACCCWQKKLADAKKLQHCAAAKSCPTATASLAAKPVGSCCSKSAQHTDHEDESAGATQVTATTDNDTPTVSISTAPCGSGKDLAFVAGEKIQHLPFCFAAGIPLQQVTRFSFLQPERLVSCNSQPPDPPPKIVIAS
jgi:hypothetical protein